MSTTAQPSTATPDEPNKEDRLRRFLVNKIENKNGDLYFKSKFIADEVGLSAKEIGAIMVKLSESASDLEIEKWSYTSATTWRVTSA